MGQVGRGHKSEVVTFPCLNCGKQMTQPIYYKNRTCSLSCGHSYMYKAHPELIERSRQHMAENMKNPEYLKAIREGCVERSKRPEYREKLRDSWKRREKSGREHLLKVGFRNPLTQRKAHLGIIKAHRHGSYFESVVANYLIKLNLKIERQYYVRGPPQLVSNQFVRECGTRRKVYLIDIALPDSKIAIEVDGEHWHRNRKVEDAERDSYLRSKGWKVIRIPASDVKTGKYVNSLEQLQ